MKLPNRRWAAAIAIAAIGWTSSACPAVLNITTVSTKADRVSGGDVLVQITQDDDTAAPVTVNGADVTNAFRAGSAPHTRLGLVTGLVLGANTITAGSVRLNVRNYPLTGPIISGPHEVPFVCTTQNFPIFSGMQKFMLADPTVFGPALDDNCSAATKITYLYMPKGGTAFQPLPSLSRLPLDISTTTTTTGETVNFIVRLETSTIDRGIYQSAILHDITSEPSASWHSPPRGWNKRLIAVEGAGCPGGWYFQGMAGGSMTIPGVIDASLLSAARLGEGYALFGNTLQNASQSCNSVLAGEAAMMGKEHFIKTFGAPVYTVSIGCSGGSYGSSQLADALPGLFDGILIGCTFPDPLSIAFSGSDGHLLTHFFNTIAPGEFSEAQQIAVSGYKNLKAFVDAANQAGRTDPIPARVDLPGYGSAVWSPAVPAALRYDPAKNPRGARPTVYDVARNVYGIDAATGFALRPYDNIGVQYGLAALNAGQITTTQFLDLNESIGGYDQDDNYVAARAAGDVGAIKRAYESGLQLGGNGGLASIPVFDISGVYNDDSGYHYQWFHFAMRDRMAQANGNTENHVMWRGNPVPFEKSWSTFVGWMEAIVADRSNRLPREKAIRDKPTEAGDGCWRSPTDFIREPQTFSRADSSKCNALYPSYAFPRYVAGGPLAANIMKCRLKPIDQKDYAVRFTPTELGRLHRIFPDGVCDWSKAGAGQTGVVPWASFGPLPETLVFDVTRLQ